MLKDVELVLVPVKQTVWHVRMRLFIGSLQKRVQIWLVLLWGNAKIPPLVPLEIVLAVSYHLVNGNHNCITSLYHVGGSMHGAGVSINFKGFM